jgi:hypothetical protein
MIHVFCTLLTHTNTDQWARTDQEIRTCLEDAWTIHLAMALFQLKRFEASLDLEDVWRSTLSKNTLNLKNQASLGLEDVWRSTLSKNTLILQTKQPRFGRRFVDPPYLEYLSLPTDCWYFRLQSLSRAQLPYNYPTSRLPQSSNPENPEKP